MPNERGALGSRRGLAQGCNNLDTAEVGLGPQITAITEIADVVFLPFSLSR